MDNEGLQYGGKQGNIQEKRESVQSESDCRLDFNNGSVYVSVTNISIIDFSVFDIRRFLWILTILYP